MSSYFKQVVLLAALTLLGFGVYVALFWIGAAASVTILFYRGILLAIVTCVVIGIAGAWLGRKVGDRSLPVAAAAVSLSMNICFLVLFPVTVDRSVTVYLLSTVERHQDAGIDADALQDAFIGGYVVKMGAIDRRIDEQRKSGNVQVSPDGKVRLTAQGLRFMSVSRTIAKLFATDPRFVGASPSATQRDRSD